MVTYRDVGCRGDAPLNTIVMAGSHDAGVTGGGWNVKTQSQDIGQQARAGVRIFDLRIAAFTSHGITGADKNVEMRAYHADGALKKQESKSRYVTEIGRAETIERTKLRAGAYGENLATILAQAAAFVRDPLYSTEFLILKFDKCFNYRLIAEACTTMLAGVIYQAGGNLNLKTLDELAGHVVVVFTNEGLHDIGNAFGPQDGILGIKNCYDAGSNYTHIYQGLQYYGKGGTKIAGRSPVSENRKKQAGLMQAGIQSDPETMGMMYWTSTGLVGDIKKRNKKMWSRTNNASLQKTWRAGLDESIRDRMDKSVRLESGGNVMKTFMPNFVMIDFADTHKCDAIMNLNNVAGHEIMQLVNGDLEAEAAEEEI